MINQSPLLRYHERYLKNKSDLKLSSDTDSLLTLIENNPSGLNNYFMAALGMSTLILRLGAIILLSRKLHDGVEENDALFMKQVVDNLSETLPTDGNWKNLWVASTVNGSEWEKPCVNTEKGTPLLDRFVTFRNNFVHQSIRIVQNDVPHLLKAINTFDEMAQLIDLFKQSTIEEKDGKFYFLQEQSTLELYPFIQKGEQDGLPYLFQGLYNNVHDNKKNAKLISTHFGNEFEQEGSLHLEPAFEPLKNALRGYSGKEGFDHSARIAYYAEWFVGRERERDALLDWCKQQTDQNILPVYSSAGMGKGALMADIICKLQEEKIPVLYHFCGAGVHNSLHATLYHFILQGLKYKPFDGISLWNNKNENIEKKLKRMPSKYIDLIHFFQQLLSDAFKNPKKNKTGNFIILIDGLDEAAVANSSLHISDWFYTYNEKEERENDWRSQNNIRWIFTYRKTEGQKGYQFPFDKEAEKIELLQPLVGLTEDAVSEALKKFKVSEEFEQAVMRKGAVV